MKSSFLRTNIIKRRNFSQREIRSGVFISKEKNTRCSSQQGVIFPSAIDLKTGSLHTPTWPVNRRGLRYASPTQVRPKLDPQSFPLTPKPAERSSAQASFLLQGNVVQVGFPAHELRTRDSFPAEPTLGLGIRWVEASSRMTSLLGDFKHFRGASGQLALYILMGRPDCNALSSLLIHSSLAQPTKGTGNDPGD